MQVARILWETSEALLLQFGCNWQRFARCIYANHVFVHSSHPGLVSFVVPMTRYINFESKFVPKSTIFVICLLTFLNSFVVDVVIFFVVLYFTFYVQCCISVRQIPESV